MFNNTNIPLHLRRTLLETLDVRLEGFDVEERMGGGEEQGRCALLAVEDGRARVDHGFDFCEGRGVVVGGVEGDG